MTNKKEELSSMKQALSNAKQSLKHCVETVDRLEKDIACYDQNRVMLKNSVMNVGNLFELFSDIPGNVPIFIEHDKATCNGKDFALVSIYYADKMEDDVQDLEWKRLVSSSDAINAVAIRLC